MSLQYGFYVLIALFLSGFGFGVVLNLLRRAVGPWLN